MTDEKFTSAVIVERLKFESLYRWKQNTRQFLDVDFSAGLQQGKAREFTREEIFLVHFADKLLKAKFPVKMVVDIVSIVKGYFTQNNFFPLKKWAYEAPPIRTKNGKDLTTLLHIVRTLNGFIVLEEITDAPTFGVLDSEWRKKEFKFNLISPGTNDGESLYFVSIDLSVELRDLCAIFP